MRGTLDDVTQTGTTWHLSVSDGPTLDATLLVIATTHPAPSLPAPLTTLEHDKRVVSNPWRDDALARIAPQESVAIIGTGLTMADIVASLSARGHKAGYWPFPAGDCGHAPMRLRLRRFRTCSSSPQLRQHWHCCGTYAPA